MKADNKIKKALQSFRCQYVTDCDENPLSLTDALSPTDTIAEGEKEIELLADHISASLFGEQAEWTRTRPTEEGWYWWKETGKDENPINWRTYYMQPVPGDTWYFLGNETRVDPPEGGWWRRVEV